MRRIDATVLLLVTLGLGLTACDERAGGTTPSSSEKQAWSLTGTSTMSNGERLARCAERALFMHYAAVKQEFGDPWRELDTFVSYDRVSGGFRVVFIGGTKTVDGAKERVEARMPAVKAAFATCERALGAREGVGLENARVAYTFVDRAKGELKDVVVWEGGKFDFPPDGAAQPVDAWMSSLP